MKSNRASTSDPKKKSSGGILETVKTIVYAVLIALVVRTVAYEPFNIPSGSMMPTLLVGDYLFVSKFSYGYSRYSLPFGLPLFSGPHFLPFSHMPQRGDVAVFKLPTDTSTDYIKRHRRPARRPHPDAARRALHQRPGGAAPARSTITSTRKAARRSRCTSTSRACRAARASRRSNTRIIKVGDNGPLDNTPVYDVPPDHYFAMGDNRDNSQDSRVLSAVGYVPAENLVGEARFLFFSTDGSARWWEFGSGRLRCATAGCSMASARPTAPRRSEPDDSTGRRGSGPSARSRVRPARTSGRGTDPSRARCRRRAGRAAARRTAHGAAAGRRGGYERLEFLGDRVLGLVIADLLWRRFERRAGGAPDAAPDPSGAPRRAGAGRRRDRARPSSAAVARRGGRRRRAQPGDPRRCLGGGDRRDLSRRRVCRGVGLYRAARGSR